MDFFFGNNKRTQTDKHLRIGVPARGIEREKNFAFLVPPTENPQKLIESNYI